MLYATMTIDLPSEPILRRRTLVDWLAQMIGREVDLSTNSEVCTATGVSVFKAVSDALARVGITDVLSVTIDDKTAYVDTEENSGDLATAVAELDARAVLEHEFLHMSMVSMHRAQQLRTLVDVGLHREVDRGAPELRVAIASRHDAMQITRGEQPGAYAERLSTLAREPAPLVEARTRLEALVAELARALTDELGELALAVDQQPVQLRLIRPGPRALDRMRALNWGPAVRMPRYRPVPVRTRRGAYREPFSHHYFDPYFDFATYVTLREIVAGRGWSGLSFEVVEADGSPAFDAASSASAAPLVGPEGPTHAQLLSIEEQGLRVAESVPHFEGPAPGELLDPTSSPGFAGSDDNVVSEMGGWQGVAEAGDVSGGELGGSCGASCGGCGG